MLLASDVKLPSNLTTVLGQQGQGAQNSLNDVYSRIKSQFGADQKARGVRSGDPNDYFSSRIGTGQNMSNLGLRGGLESVLGDTGYKDTLSERDYQQNYELAKRIGDLMSPSILEQVLGGLGGGAQAGGQFYGLYDKFQKQQMKPYTPTSPVDTSRYLGGGSGLNLIG